VRDVLFCRQYITATGSPDAVTRIAAPSRPQQALAGAASCGAELTKTRSKIKVAARGTAWASILDRAKFTGAQER
jgi:hypothetical protein